MPDSFADLKRQTLEKRRAALIEEYRAAATQLSRTLDDVSRLRLQRGIENLEQEIQRIEDELRGLGSQAPPEAPPAKPRSAPGAAAEASKAARKLRVFLCHASGDKPAMRDLYRRLLAGGVDRAIWI